MKYKVVKIQEADYGCEERPAGYVPKVIIRLCDESGHETEMEVPDADLYAKNIGEGDSVFFDDDNKINKATEAAVNKGDDYGKTAGILEE